MPPQPDERACLLGFLAQQRDALRYAAHGLTDEQAASRSSVSGLCLGGLIKHAAQVERAWTTFLATGDSGVFAVPDDYDRRVSPGRRGDAGRHCRPRTRSRRATPRPSCARLDDLGAPLPPTTDVVPWIPAGLVWTPRWVLLHLIEELARHAGHADIIRESIDGATCWTLMAAAEGWPQQAWT